jgi:hypothetical protein
MSIDALLHPCLQCQPPSSVLDRNCCSPSHHLVSASTDWSYYSPLSMVELCLWFYGSWVWLGCWPHTEFGFSTFWCADPTPTASSSYLVALVVVDDVGDLEAWSGVGSSNSSVGPPVFLYGCTGPLLHLIQWYLLPLARKSLFLTIDGRCPFLFSSSRSLMAPPSLMVHGSRFSLSSNLRSQQIHRMFRIYTYCIMSPRIYI